MFTLHQPSIEANMLESEIKSRKRRSIDERIAEIKVKIQELENRKTLDYFRSEHKAKKVNIIQEAKRIVEEYIDHDYRWPDTKSLLDEVCQKIKPF